MNESFMRKVTVLVIDCEGELSLQIEAMLAAKVKSIHYIKDPVEALKEFNRISPQLVITDLKLAMMDIVEFVSKIKSLNTECELVMALGFVEPHRLIEMVNLGVYRFVMKPLSMPKLSESVLKAMETLFTRATAFQSKCMQEILNAEDNPVFETDGTTILKANKAFLDCFGAKNVKQFGLTLPDLASLFNFGEAERLSTNWLKDFIQGSEEPKLLIYDSRKAEKREFYLEFGISEVTKGNFIVSMTDITEMERSFNRKLEMLSSQINSKEKIKFRSMLEFEIARCKRYKKSFSLALISFEIEECESIEDWEMIFKVLRRTLRSSDLFAKVDKNQLAVIATETQKHGAKILLKRVEKEFELLKKKGCGIGFKAGTVEFVEGDTSQTLFKKVVSGI